MGAAQSPDFNPIENLWEVVNQRIDRQNCSNKQDWFKEVQPAWENFPSNIIQNLIASIPNKSHQGVKK